MYQVAHFGRSVSDVTWREAPRLTQLAMKSSAAVEHRRRFCFYVFVIPGILLIVGVPVSATRLFIERMFIKFPLFFFVCKFSGLFFRVLKALFFFSWRKRKIGCGTYTISTNSSTITGDHSK